jgi:hypothetical protein
MRRRLRRQLLALVTDLGNLVLEALVLLGSRLEVALLRLQLGDLAIRLPMGFGVAYLPGNPHHTQDAGDRARRVGAARKPEQVNLIRRLSVAARIVVLRQKRQPALDVGLQAHPEDTAEILIDRSPGADAGVVVADLRNPLGVAQADRIGDLHNVRHERGIGGLVPRPIKAQHQSLHGNDTA